MAGHIAQKLVSGAQQLKEAKKSAAYRLDDGFNQLDIARLMAP
jgi:hypothetical protein